jgi:hypothetical protein
VRSPVRLVAFAFALALAPGQARAFVSPGYARECQIPSAMLGTWRGLEWRKDGVLGNQKSATLTVEPSGIVWKLTWESSGASQGVRRSNLRVCAPGYARFERATYSVEVMLLADERLLLVIDWVGGTRDEALFARE